MTKFRSDSKIDDKETTMAIVHVNPGEIPGTSKRKVAIPLNKLNQKSSSLPDLLNLEEVPYVEDSTSLKRKSTNLSDPDIALKTTPQEFCVKYEAKKAQANVDEISIISRAPSTLAVCPRKDTPIPIRKNRVRMNPGTSGDDFSNVDGSSVLDITPNNLIYNRHFGYLLAIFIFPCIILLIYAIRYGTST